MNADSYFLLNTILMSTPCMDISLQPIIPTAVFAIYAIAVKFHYVVHLLLCARTLLSDDDAAYAVALRHLRQLSVQATKSILAASGVRVDGCRQQHHREAGVIPDPSRKLSPPPLPPVLPCSSLQLRVVVVGGGTVGRRLLHTLLNDNDNEDTDYDHDKGGASARHDGHASSHARTGKRTTPSSKAALLASILRNTSASNDAVDGSNSNILDNSSSSSSSSKVSRKDGGECEEDTMDRVNVTKDTNHGNATDTSCLVHPTRITVITRQPGTLDCFAARGVTCVDVRHGRLALRTCDLLVLACQPAQLTEFTAPCFAALGENDEGDGTMVGRPPVSLRPEAVVFSSVAAVPASKLALLLRHDARLIVCADVNPVQRMTCARTEMRTEAETVLEADVCSPMPHTSSCSFPSRTDAKAPAALPPLCEEPAPVVHTNRTCVGNAHLAPIPSSSTSLSLQTLAEDYTHIQQAYTGPRVQAIADDDSFLQPAVREAATAALRKETMRCLTAAAASDSADTNTDADANAKGCVRLPYAIAYRHAHAAASTAQQRRYLTPSVDAQVRHCVPLEPSFAAAVYVLLTRWVSLVQQSGEAWRRQKELLLSSSSAASSFASLSVSATVRRLAARWPVHGETAGAVCVGLLMLPASTHTSVVGAAWRGRWAQRMRAFVRRHGDVGLTANASTPCAWLTSTTDTEHASTTPTVYGSSTSPERVNDGATNTSRNSTHVKTNGIRAGTVTRQNGDTKSTVIRAAKDGDPLTVANDVVVDGASAKVTRCAMHVAESDDDAAQTVPRREHGGDVRESAGEKSLAARRVETKCGVAQDVENVHTHVPQVHTNVSAPTSPMTNENVCARHTTMEEGIYHEDEDDDDEEEEAATSADECLRDGARDETRSEEAESYMTEMDEGVAKWSRAVSRTQRLLPSLFASDAEWLGSVQEHFGNVMRQGVKNV